MALSLPGGGAPVARWSSGSLRFRGVLRPGGDGVVLEADFRGGGLAFAAEVDITRERSLFAEKRVVVDEWLTLRPGARMHALGGLRGYVRASLPRWVTEAVEPASPVVVSLRCEDTNIFRPRGHWGEAEDWAAVSVPPSAPAARLPSGEEVPLRAAPGGVVRARFRATKYGHFVRVLERQENWTRIAWSHFTGAAVFGWVPTRVVAPATGGWGGLGMIGGRSDVLVVPPPPPRRCQVSHQLWVRQGPLLRAVGTLRPPATFRVVGPADKGLVPVVLVGPVRLDALQGAAFALPEAAAACGLVGALET